MPDSIPAFGDRQPGIEYRLRPGSYAILRNERNEIAVVLTPGGAFLPGGGQEAGETPQDALRREVREECGLEVEAGALIATADELVAPARGSARDSAGFQKRCAFFAARIVGHDGARVDTDHELAWWPIATAARDLHHASQRWVIQQAISQAAGDSR